jgi:hypothetical protein
VWYKFMTNAGGWCSVDMAEVTTRQRVEAELVANSDLVFQLLDPCLSCLLGPDHWSRSPSMYVARLERGLQRQVWGPVVSGEMVRAKYWLQQGTAADLHMLLLPDRYLSTRPARFVWPPYAKFLLGQTADIVV